MNTKHTPAPWTVNPKAKTNIRHGNLTIANCSSTHDGSREEEEETKKEEGEGVSSDDG